MIFMLKPDDNGVVVALTNVDEADVKALENAEKRGFDPTEPPFNKYYAYDKRIGFYVSKDYFDHAEHKGKRLSFADYMSLISDGEIIEATDAMKAVDALKAAKDAKYDADFVFERIKEIKIPKTANESLTTLSNVIFALSKLDESIDEADEDQKKKFHDALQHAFDIYAKADDILFKSDFMTLKELNDRLSQYRSTSSNVQAKLLQKYHENF